MPRTVELTLPTERTDEVVGRLQEQDEVLSPRPLRGASLDPPGDVVSLDVLDTGMAE